RDRAGPPVHLRQPRQCGRHTSRHPQPAIGRVALPHRVQLLGGLPARGPGDPRHRGGQAGDPVRPGLTVFSRMDPVIALKMWRTLEPIHGMIYFAPEAAAAYQDIGIDDFRMGYFSSRSAPMGAVAADVVIAT